jgi:hypothetical protein
MTAAHLCSLGDNVTRERWWATLDADSEDYLPRACAVRHRTRAQSPGAGGRSNYVERPWFGTAGDLPWRGNPGSRDVSGTVMGSRRGWMWHFGAQRKV